MMTPQEQFQFEAIRSVINHWLGSIDLQSVPDLSKMTENQSRSYKSGAKAVLSSKTYQGEMARITETAKNKIALQTKGDLEVAYYRGIIAGMKFFDDALRSMANAQSVTSSTSDQ